VNHTRLLQEETCRSPKFLENPSENVPRARDSGAPGGLALTAAQILPSVESTTSALATKGDFGAVSSRPTFSLPTLQPQPVTRPEARLASGLPATALTGLDFHQLDSFERFHQLILNSPFPSLAWRDDSDPDPEKLIFMHLGATPAHERLR
jgi:hypothetical protein